MLLVREKGNRVGAYKIENAGGKKRRKRSKREGGRGGRNYGTIADFTARPTSDVHTDAGEGAHTPPALSSVCTVVIYSGRQAHS